MSQQKPKTITLRRLEPGEAWREGDFYRAIGGRNLYCAQGEQPEPDSTFYRVASPIPDGFEVCDLADATKVLIGETWCNVTNKAMGEKWLRMPNHTVLDIKRLTGLGVLAIRPIPEPEPMRGESRVCKNQRSEDSGLVHLPARLIGEWVRWEVVKDGGE